MSVVADELPLVPSKAPVFHSVHNQTWTNKYQVRHLADVCGHGPTIQYLAEMLTKPDKLLCNMIFYGESGTGKTTLMNCIIEHSFGADNFGRDCTADPDFVLRTNASNERCFVSVEKKMRSFIERSSQECTARGLKRIIALDEVDSMTTEAQGALQCLVEKHSDRICFLLTCNDIVNNVSRPLQSKCVALHLDRVDPNSMALLVLRIAEAERITVTRAGVDALVLAANGDVRRMLNDYQAVYCIDSIMRDDDARLQETRTAVLTEETVFSISHTPSSVAILHVLDVCVLRDFRGAMTLVRNLVESTGYDVSDIITLMYHLVVTNKLFVCAQDERVLLHFHGVLCASMVLATKQQASVRSLGGIIANLCRHQSSAPAAE